ncbi:MAG: prolyl oligopeptidase family serine peptidase [Cyclobacteriaceae bacterium]|nr:prolyl oligopeptidase family serine peptidase [Cyclobacteriaceae bacterium]
MLKHTLIIIAVCCLMLPATAQDTTAFKAETFTSSADHVLPYRILYPDDYKKGKKYPVVLFLHGAGERGDNNVSQLIHGSKLFANAENRKKFPAIVIFPQCAKESYWSAVEVDRTQTPFTLAFDYTKPITPPLQAAIELLQRIIQQGSVDQSRIYITGLSMGGMGTFEAVYRYPNLFAAAMPICGGADLNAYDERVVKVPFRVFHGADDAVVSVDQSQKIVEKLKTLNVAVEYIEYPGVNHNSWDKAFAEPDYLSWMFSRKRK